MSSSYHDDDEFLGKAYDARLLRRLIPYARPHLRLVLGGTGFMLLAAICELTIPLIIRETVNGPFSWLVPGFNGQVAATPPGDSAPLSERLGFVGAVNADDAWLLLGWFAFAFLGLIVVQLFARFWNTYLFQKLGQRAIFDIRHDAYAHIQKMPLRFYDRNPVGRLVTRVTNDVEAIGEVFSAGLVQLAGEAIVVLGALALMMMLSWKLALIVVCAVPLVAALTWVFRGRARGAFRDMRVKLAIVNSFLNETIQGWRITRIFGTEKKMAAKFDQRSERYLNSTYHTIFNFALFFPIVEFAGTATVLVLIWYGTGSIFAGTLDFGTFMAFFLLTPMMFRPIREMSEKYNIMQSAMASAERLFRIMDEVNEIKDPEHPLAPEIAGEIEFRNVWFAYPAAIEYSPDAQVERPAGAENGTGASPAVRSPAWVLRDVSFKVPAGGSLALVGATGSGKTTIISLLMRFYDVQKGSILIDGVDVREMTKAHLRSAFSLVLQDVFLFAGDVLDNIRLGDRTIDEARVVRAAKAVHAHEFIESLPGGYRAIVAERGATFSSGQRQLLAFARALAFDPRILVLDEATSNIDSETEALIQDALAKLMRGRTAVVVAHRLSTITGSDNILVMHQGKLVEQGTHQQLLEQGGIYAKLYQLQFANGARTGQQAG